MSEIFETSNNKLSILSELGGGAGSAAAGGVATAMAGFTTAELCDLAASMAVDSVARAKYITLDAGPRQRV